MKYSVALGRLFYSLIFLMAAPGHFSAGTIGYAQSQGVPLASLAVPLSGVLALLGGLSILLGFKARWGAGLLILFLVPVTFMMHAFWKIDDPMQAQMQQIMFMKNIALIGTALIFAHFGAGPVSIDARRGE